MGFNTAALLQVVDHQGNPLRYGSRIALQAYTAAAAIREAGLNGSILAMAAHS